MSGNESGGMCKSSEAGVHKLFFTKTSSLFYFVSCLRHKPCIILNLGGSGPEHRQHYHSVDGQGGPGEPQPEQTWNTINLYCFM